MVLPPQTVCPGARPPLRGDLTLRSMHWPVHSAHRVCLLCLAPLHILGSSLITIC